MALVKPSIRPAANCIMYAYYARVGRSIDEALCENIFESNIDGERSADVSQVDKFDHQKLSMCKSRKKVMSESDFSNNSKAEDFNSWWINFEPRLTTAIL